MDEVKETAEEKSEESLSGLLGIVSTTLFYIYMIFAYGLMAVFFAGALWTLYYFISRVIIGKADTLDWIFSVFLVVPGGVIILAAIVGLISKLKKSNE